MNCPEATIGNIFLQGVPFRWISKKHMTRLNRALETILREMKFHTRYITWIITCVIHVSYKYSINGEHNRFLKARIGLRQEAHLPLQFVLIMEYLHTSLHNNHNFTFLPKCARLHITEYMFWVLRPLKGETLTPIYDI